MSRRINLWQKPNRTNENGSKSNPKQSRDTKHSEGNQSIYESTRFKTMDELLAEQNAKLEARRQELNNSFQTSSNPIQPTVEDEESESGDSELTTSELLDQLRRGKRQTQPRHIPRSQRRGRFCLSVSVSEEDELVFRAAAAAADMTFSEWARNAMYKYAKVKPPKRIKK